MSRVTIVFILGLMANSCQCLRGAQTSSTPDVEQAIQSVSRVLGTGRVKNTVSVMRLTPEQASNSIYKAFGFRLGWDDYDVIKQSYAVPLGGVDFVSASERDPTTKIQSLLVARSIAWAAAQEVIWSEAQRSEANRTIFTHCDLNSDRPFNSDDALRSQEEQDSIREGAVRWRAQLDEFYLRLFSRLPTTEEASAVESAFTAIAQYNGEGEWAGFGWMGILYAMLSSEEFWNS